MKRTNVSCDKLELLHHMAVQSKTKHARRVEQILVSGSQEIIDRCILEDWAAAHTSSQWGRSCKQRTSDLSVHDYPV